ILQIKVLEGLTGMIEVKGNRYFKSALLRKQIDLNDGDYFNYNILREGLRTINQHPDRNVRAVLAAGKEPQKTDVTLEVEDHFPIHIGFDWDNLGSRYSGKQRYTVRLEDNNLLGLDDHLNFAYQESDTQRYSLRSGKYILPVHGWELGILGSYSKVELGRELRDLDIRGKSESYGLFVNRDLINSDISQISAHLGFDYDNTTNYQAAVVTSKDRLRVVKSGFDMDVT